MLKSSCMKALMSCMHEQTKSTINKVQHGQTCRSTHVLSNHEEHIITQSHTLCEAFDAARRLASLNNYPKTRINWCQFKLQASGSSYCTNRYYKQMSATRSDILQLLTSMIHLATAKKTTTAESSNCSDANAINTVKTTTVHYWCDSTHAECRHPPRSIGRFYYMQLHNWSHYMSQNIRNNSWYSYEMTLIIIALSDDESTTQLCLCCDFC